MFQCWLCTSSNWSEPTQRLLIQHESPALEAEMLFSISAQVHSEALTCQTRCAASLMKTTRVDDLCICRWQNRMALQTQCHSSYFASMPPLVWRGLGCASQ